MASIEVHQLIAKWGAPLFKTPPLNAASQIELSVKLPEIADPFLLSGEVIWSKPSEQNADSFECGVAFENVKTVQNQDKFIYFIADKFCGTSEKKSNTFNVRPASSLEDIKASYTLTYNEYIKRKYCKEHSSKLHYTYFSMLPNSRTFILEKNSKILGTLGLIADSPCGLPMESLFPHEIASLRSQGSYLAENSLLALDQSLLGKGSFSLTHSEKHSYFFYLVKLMVETAQYMGITDLVIAVHPKHEPLYKYLSFERIGEVKRYPGANNNLALPMRWRINPPTQNMKPKSGIHRFFEQKLFGPETLKSRYEFTTENLETFLTSTRDLWTNMPLDAKAYFKKSYGFGGIQSELI